MENNIGPKDGLEQKVDNVSDLADHNRTIHSQKSKLGQHLCANADLFIENVGAEGVEHLMVKNREGACQNPRRDGSKWCHACSDAWHDAKGKAIKA